MLSRGKCQKSLSTAKRAFSSALLSSMNVLVTGRVCARCFESRQQQHQIASRSPFFRQRLPCRQQQFWGQRRLLTDPFNCFAAGRAQNRITQVQMSHAWGVMHNLLSAVLGIRFQRCTRRIACSTRGSLSQVMASGSDDRPASDDKRTVHLFRCAPIPDSGGLHPGAAHVCCCCHAYCCPRQMHARSELLVQMCKRFFMCGVRLAGNICRSPSAEAVFRAVVGARGPGGPF